MVVIAEMLDWLVEKKGWGFTETPRSSLGH
jgi:Ni,Fe-hydrogenase I large subunit